MRMIKLIGLAILAFAISPSGYAISAPLADAPQSPPSLVTPVALDCHSDVRRHFLPQFGRKVLHRHRADCRVVVVERNDDDDDMAPRDCHRDVQRHYLPEFGRKVTHRHVGPNCRVRVYEERDTFDSDDQGGNCVKLGPISYCEQ